MLELVVLGLLMQGPMHGYDLRKRIREEFGPLANLSFGSLYPALGRMEQAGAIEVLTGGTPDLPRPAPAPGEAGTGSLTGERAVLVARRASAVATALAGRGTRARKVYAITASGELLFARLLDSPDTPPGQEVRGFWLRIAFARHLTPQARLRLLERQRMHLLARLERADDHLARPARQLDRYERAIAAHVRETLASDLAWTERLLADERNLVAPKEPAPPPALAGLSALAAASRRQGASGRWPGPADAAPGAAEDRRMTAGTAGETGGAS